MTTGCMTFQNFYKKATGRPSRPGADPTFMDEIARPTSSSENGRSNSSFSLSETRSTKGQKPSARETPLPRGSVVKSSLYKEYIWELISSGCSRRLSPSQRRGILHFLLRPLTRAWKYAVFALRSQFWPPRRFQKSSPLIYLHERGL